MRYKRSLYCLLLLPLVNLFSCYAPRYVYGPPAQNVPVMIKKGDSKLAGYYSSNLSGKTVLEQNNTRKSSSSGFDVQAAYALSNHLAVQASLMNRKEKNFADFNLNRNDTSTIFYKRNLVELGVGYYNASNRDRVIFQVFGGAAFGKSTFDDIFQGNMPGLNRHLSMNVLRLYLQPAFTIKFQQFATSISSRFSAVRFSKIDTDYTPIELKSYQLQALGTQNEYFWEPAMINSFGFKNLPGVQIEFQLGMSFLTSEHPIDYRTFNFSAGIMLDIPAMLKGED